MIKSFKHKGLDTLFNTGSKKGINPDHVEKLMRILDNLETAFDAKDMNFPGYALHELSGDLAGYWSVKVSGNWRVIFSFKGEDVIDVDYLDYH